MRAILLRHLLVSSNGKLTSYDVLIHLRTIKSKLTLTNWQRRVHVGRQLLPTTLEIFSKKQFLVKKLNILAIKLLFSSNVTYFQGKLAICLSSWRRFTHYVSAYAPASWRRWQSQTSKLGSCPCPGPLLVKWTSIQMMFVNNLTIQVDLNNVFP